MLLLVLGLENKNSSGHEEAAARSRVAAIFLFIAVIFVLPVFYSVTVNVSRARFILKL